ncbi:putative solute carrier family 35, member E3 [Monocercomonoides exilis]|uniref:putative solute carrier family 35, member E3 n=1 Tax=Monocercomonoides exilis TaxID=2049356 RepID=UPI0035595DD8|nr:putative solute carrier family 35, member E3 [Monocercomonoides exilis]|eukprot:MONOS_7773.1-p1 / transcript=MONOS_7773.1 / gene=MONOS_7773 / organism=Monocercomonoides_exilis_PA203 / gene_product=solute carrier family 35, member E3 / transcript_product=solute carrier family 35, member E3 / location=Mono_scaffold00274:54463-55754(+) / protein_length=312 / sequence_SO=supercontig / SO=protein_coding / is_pseudo=false
MNSEKEHYSNVQIATPLFLNWFCCVSVVLVNKFAFKQWPFGTTLTMIHFFTTFSVLCMLCLLKVFQFKWLSIRKVLPLSISFCASIVLNNLSIQYNSVGFYQTMKIAAMPCVCLIEFIFYKKRFPVPIQASLLVIMVGIGLCTVQDFSMNIKGFIIGASGAFASALYVIMSRSKQTELNCNEYQILLFETPISALLLLSFVAFQENYSFTDPSSIWNVTYTPTIVAAILVTATLSVGVNISLFVVTRRTSALTYSVVSNLKTVSILVLGTLLFKETLSLRKIIGMIITVSGVFIYSYLNILEKQKNAPKTVV